MDKKTKRREGLKVILKAKRKYYLDKHSLFPIPTTLNLKFSARSCRRICLSYMHIWVIGPQNCRWNSTSLKDTGGKCMRKKTTLTIHAQEMGSILSVIIQKSDLQTTGRVPWNCQKWRKKLWTKSNNHFYTTTQIHSETVFLALTEVLIPSPLLHYIPPNLYKDIKGTENSSTDPTASKLGNST